MTDRDAFHTAILAAPADDTLRLVFADWLDEHGSTDQDRARAEFIRLGCSSTLRRQLPETGRWLDANWHRLLPSVVGTGVTQSIYNTKTRGIHRVPGSIAFTRTGRNIHIDVPYAACGPERRNTFSEGLNIRFWRGFAERFIVSAPKSFLFFAGLMRLDDPLAEARWASPYLSSYEMGFRLNRGTWGPLFELLEGYDSRNPAEAQPDYIANKDWAYHANPGREDSLSRYEDHAHLYRRVMDSINAASREWMDIHPGEVWVAMPRLNWRRITPPLLDPGWEELLDADRSRLYPRPRR